jgi:hypothetical protein
VVEVEEDRSVKADLLLKMAEAETRRRRNRRLRRPLLMHTICKRGTNQATGEEPTGEEHMCYHHDDERNATTVCMILSTRQTTLRRLKKTTDQRRSKMSIHQFGRPIWMTSTMVVVPLPVPSQEACSSALQQQDRIHHTIHRIRQTNDTIKHQQDCIYHTIHCICQSNNTNKKPAALHCSDKIVFIIRSIVFVNRTIRTCLQL